MPPGPVLATSQPIRTTLTDNPLYHLLWVFAEADPGPGCVGNKAINSLQDPNSQRAAQLTGEHTADMFVENLGLQGHQVPDQFVGPFSGTHTKQTPHPHSCEGVWLLLITTATPAELNSVFLSQRESCLEEKSPRELKNTCDSVAI